MPLMEIRLVQSFAGQTCINTWNYLSNGTPAAVSLSFALASACGFIPVGNALPADSMADLIRQMQSIDVTWQSISVRDVYSVTDFYETPYGGGIIGGATGQALSPFTAYGFVSSKTRTDIRRGQKRFVGASESNVGAQGALEPLFRDGLVADVAEQMSVPLNYNDEGNTISFAPVIVGKEKYQVPNTTPPRFAYRYYESGFAEQAQHLMESITWTGNPFVTTQNSRKRGRGV